MLFLFFFSIFTFKFSSYFHNLSSEFLAILKLQKWFPKSLQYSTYYRIQIYAHVIGSQSPDCVENAYMYMYFHLPQTISLTAFVNHA